MGVNPSDNKFLWMRYLGAGPERAMERFEGYESSSGLRAAGHYAMALLESIPIVGGAISFLDKVCFGYKPSPKVYAVVSPLLAIKTPQKKEVKKVNPLIAKQEVSMKDKQILGKNGVALDETLFFLIRLQMVIEYIEDVKDSICPLELVCAEQGEEASRVIFEVDEDEFQGMCYGVFEGYGGKEVAEYAKAAYKEWFAPYLSLYRGDVQKAFKAIIGDISIDITSKNLPWNGISSNALICYIDTKMHKAHIGTVGNSEACLIHEGQEEIIPLSMVNSYVLRGHTGNPNVTVSQECIYQECPIKIGDKVVLMGREHKAAMTVTAKAI